MPVLTNGSILKIKAREIIRTSNPSAIKVGMLFIIISLIFSLLSTYLVGARLDEHDIVQITKHLENGNVDYAYAYMAESMPRPSAQLINLVMQVVMHIVSVGFIIFILNTIRVNAPCYGNLLDGFGMPVRIIVLNLLIGIFVFLWSLLLIVPGFIAAYKYRMATYLLIDHPEYSPMQCIRESKRLMQGHKAELFALDMSFLGWALLALLPIVGWLVEIWNTPYFATTYALYYQELSGVTAGDSSYNSYGSYNNYNGPDWQ